MGQDHQFHLVRISTNAKLGGLPASTTSSDSCPNNCSYRDNGCYGDSGPLSIHWGAVDKRKRGDDLSTFCAKIKALPKYQLWRHNQVGDLPGDGLRVNQPALHKIVSANRGKKGFTFTHYSPLLPENAEAIKYANKMGFTINVSAETLQEADVYVDLKVGPVVVALPASARRHTQTPAGHEVKVCPATLSTSTTCATCAMCADPDRKTVIGFPAHGSGKAKVEKVFFSKQL